MEQDTYTLLRQFADSWFLLAMMIFFIGAVAFAFRPGSRRTHRDIADIPLRDDDPSRLRDDGGRADRDGGEGGTDKGADAPKAGRRRDAGRPIEES